MHTHSLRLHVILAPKWRQVNGPYMLSRCSICAPHQLLSAAAMLRAMHAGVSSRGQALTRESALITPSSISPHAVSLAASRQVRFPNLFLLAAAIGASGGACSPGAGWGVQGRGAGRVLPVGAWHPAPLLPIAAMSFSQHESRR